MSYIDSGNCFKCIKNYYFNKIECVKVALEIADCENYDSSISCRACSNGTYKDSNGKCQPMAKPIPDCAEHAATPSLDAIVCARCNTGFQWDPATRKCVANPANFAALPNCDVQEQQTCKRCNVSSFMPDKLAACVKLTVDNCSDHAVPGTCKKCKTDFSLKDPQTCVAVDTAKKLPGCDSYNASGTC